MTTIRTATMVLAGAVLGATLTIGQNVLATKNSSSNSLPLEQMRTFTLSVFKY